MATDERETLKGRVSPDLKRRFTEYAKAHGLTGNGALIVLLEAGLRAEQRKR